MPRIRNIKPETFDDPDLNGLPALARWLFVGLWTQADRDGRLEDEPRRLKARILPYDDANCDELLDLLDGWFITRYEADGRNFIQVNNFSKHQHCHKDEKPSTIPAPAQKSPGKPGNIRAKTPISCFLNPENGRAHTGRHAPAGRLTVDAVFGSDDAESGAGQRAPVADDPAGWLLRSWPVWFSEERHGAKTIMREARDFPLACDIVAAWPDRAYLEKLARTFLGSESDKLKWCAERSLAQFVTAAPGIDAWMRAA
jgi:hypothetical protein